MTGMDNEFKLLKKLYFTIRNFPETAYHHYGRKPSSLVRFIGVGLKVNTFYVYENSLSTYEMTQRLDPEYRVVKPSLEELAAIRKGKDLPREFYYDRIYNTKKCYLAFRKDEIAYIHWVFFWGDYSRFLVFPDDVVEINYNTTLPAFRGNNLSAKMMAYISSDLKKDGFRKVVGVIHESNVASIKAIQKAGFFRIANIKSVGPFSRRLRVV